MKVRAKRSLWIGIAALVMVSGCAGGVNPFARDTAADTSVATQKSVKLIDRDVEAPDIFQADDQALWDGRPSLGGVWVASADALDPERVIMRNPANGKFVIGALFKRERDNPGPSLQISSDAAAALGMLAGQPAKISVTALRREEAPAEVDATQPLLDTSETIESETLNATAPQAAGTPNAVAGAAAALDRVQSAQPAAQLIAPSGRLIQIGLFSVEANANRAAAMLTAAGIPASIRASTSNGKPLWSVTARGDAATLSKIKSAGFDDAYFTKG